MKKLIITTAALLVLTFVACKKNNLQPTSNPTGSEQQNIEAIENDKLIDARNKFVGNWRGDGYIKTFYVTGGPSFHSLDLTYKIKIVKTTANRLKVTENSYMDDGQLFESTIMYTKVNPNKVSFFGINSNTKVNGVIINASKLNYSSRINHGDNTASENTVTLIK